MSRLPSIVVAITIGASMVYATEVVPQQIRGIVIDDNGKPASKVEIGSYWTPNDWFDDNGKLRDLKQPTELKKFWTNTGRMRPSGGVTKTDDRGHFVLAVPRLQWQSGVLAFDASRQSGGIATLRGDNENLEIVVHLQPLVHLYGKLRLAETGSVPDWSVMCVYLPLDERKPLAYSRVAACGSWDGNVSVMLPPGEYELEANTETSEVLNPETLRVKLTKTKLDYDLGTLRLYPHVSLGSKVNDAKKRGEWGDYTKSFGRSPPLWHAVAARGISVKTKPSDLKGKWTLLYFFTFNCGHCLATGLPAAAQFYELNRDKRSKFEIIGFCIDYSGDLSTLGKLERKLQPIVKNVWKGKDLPFPLLLDNTFTTQKTYGITRSPTEVLIDPDGKLAKGGLKELAEKIGASAPAL